MRIQVKASGVLVTPAFRKYIEDKLTRPLEKILGRDAKNDPLLEIEFSRSTQHHKKGRVWYAEANLALGKRVLRGEAEGEDPHETIDILEDEFLREVKRFRSKAVERERKSARELKRRLRGG